MQFLRRVLGSHRASPAAPPLALYDSAAAPDSRRADTLLAALDIDAASFEPGDDTVRVPLVTLAWARSGDKGDDENIGVSDFEVNYWNIANWNRKA